VGSRDGSTRHIVALAGPGKARTSHPPRLGGPRGLIVSWARRRSLGSRHTRGFHCGRAKDEGSMRVGAARLVRWETVLDKGPTVELT
jgi:hypothetical protein